jgi:Fe-S oxidoreductase
MTALKVVALIVALAATVIGIAVFARGVGRIVAVVRTGGPAPGRAERPGQRTVTTLREILGHGRFAQRPIVRAAHWAVMLSFPILFLTLLTGYGQLVDPAYALPGIGHLAPLEWLIEAFAWAGLIGITALVVVRQVTRITRPGRASRFFGSNTGQAYFVEATIAVVVLAVLALRGLEYALAAADPAAAGLATAWHFPLTAWYGARLTETPAGTLEALVVVIALAKILASMAWFVVVGLQPAMGVAWHRFLAVVNLWTRREPDGRPALGELAPILVGGKPLDLEALEDLPDDAVLGAGKPSDLSWKGLLDASTCTECGRCQDACPAWATDKPLSPKLMTLSIRDAAFGGADDALVGTAIDPDALWACTTCGACVQECPVDIEHVDTFVELRRHEVLMAASFPPELAAMFRKLESTGNPWGLPARARADWMKGLAFPVPVVGVDVEDLLGVDYLFWVGCAGAYDDKAKTTTRAVAELLHTAGVSFAVLGKGETCTGDPARRSGNEVLFQMLAAQNVATLTEAKATKIVATCAHCFNTLSREYPQLDGTYEVVHHTQLLNRLVREGRLVPMPPPKAETRTITYHDPCYLGRHNEVYAPPRELLGALPGLEVTEMPRHEERSFCCGAGGGRAFMQETIGTRINVERATEAVATGASAVATGCPFCTVMLTDGVAAARSAAGSSDDVQVLDVAQLLLASVRRGQAADTD